MDSRLPRDARLNTYDPNRDEHCPPRFALRTGDIDVLEWMLYIRNLNMGQRGRVAELMYPEVGKRFVRTVMKAVVNAMSGNIKPVLVPGIPELGLKALVNLA